MSRAVIITAYLDHPVDLPSLLTPEDYIVCLDGGYDIAQRQGIPPDLLLGDMDSLKTPLPDEPAFEVRRFPPEKDYTDLELAIRILDPAKTCDILIIGGLGGRLDQTLINIHMLARYTAAPAAKADLSDLPGSDEPDPLFTSAGPEPLFRRIEAMDGHNRCFAVHGHGCSGPRSTLIPAAPSCYLSLIPLTDRCEGVSLEGVKYPLKNAVLKRGASLSISNEFRAEHARLTIAEGSILVVIAKATVSTL